MKRTVLMALMLSLLAGSVAMADGRDTQKDRNRGRDDHTSRNWQDNDRHDARDWHDNGRHDGRDWRDNDRRDGRRDWRNDDRRDGRDWRDNHSRRYWAGNYHRPPGYVVRSWHRGDRLPWAYRTRTYIVNDYNVYHLRRPPRGYHWVRVNQDVVLTAIATGLVLEVLSNYFY
jgi:Ni/Co efflux regulator RcnB